MRVCNASSDPVEIAIKQRIFGCDLTSVKARYHKKCSLKFWKHMPAETITDTQLTHWQFLRRVCDLNGMSHVNTVGGGNCFYDAVRMGCLSVGLPHITIQQLRSMTADQLQLRNTEFRPLYRLEAPEQALNYDQFIINTRSSNEWATQMSIAACVRGLQRIVRIVSIVNGTNGKPTAHISDYSEGVAAGSSNSVIVVGHLQDEAHYVSLGIMSENINHLTLPYGIVVTVNALMPAVPSLTNLRAVSVHEQQVADEVENDNTDSVCDESSHTRDISNVVELCAAERCDGDDVGSMCDGVEASPCIDEFEEESMFVAEEDDEGVEMMNEEDQLASDSSDDEAEQCECCRRISTTVHHIHV